MGGSSKKQTVSWWYKLIAHFGLSLGPIDALLEIRGGDRTAWKGEKTTSGIISINKPDLYGGEKKEGGIVGDFELMMGEPDQAPNSYLAQWFGAMQGAYRGVCTILFRGGKIGAGNPYPKALYFKLRRILKGWDNGGCWYPEKAPVPMIAGYIQMLGSGWEYQIENYSEPNTVWNNFVVPEDGWLQGGELPFSTNGMSGGEYWTPTRSNIWLRRRMVISAVGLTLNIAADNGCVVWVDGVEVGSSNPTNADISGNDSNPVSFEFSAAGEVEVVVKAFSEVNLSDEGGNIVKLEFVGAPMLAMNPAHILYDSITSRKETGGMQEPIGKINEASFTAAANKFYAEGLGLCMKRVGGQTAEEFQQRVCDIAGVCLTQDQTDGQYYIDMLRGDYVLEDLQVITDDDILSWSAEPTAVVGAVNQMQVKYFDVEKRAEGITTPVQALGAIMDTGGVVAAVKDYPEIPIEALALRLADRDLSAANTPTWKFDFTCNRKAYKLRPGVYVRLMCPKRGFADVVIVVGDVSYGDMDDSAIRVEAVQDIFGLADTVYVVPQGTTDPSGAEEATAATDSLIIEAPYIELAAALDPAVLAEIEPETGYIGATASRPGNAWNYTLATKAAGEEYAESVDGNWSPKATIVEAADELTEDFTFTDGLDLDRIAVGSWALWDDEIVRVDAIGAGTVSFGRGCADTVPMTHDADSTVVFCGDWLATDGRQYLDSETVSAKLLTKTANDKLDISLAPEVSVVMNSRALRPYPPGNVKIGGVAYPETVADEFTVTWSHRNRESQADTLIDTTAGDVTPVDNTRYALRFYDAADALLVEKTDIGPGLAAVTLAYTGDVTMELSTVDPNGESLQKHVLVFAYTMPVGATESTITADSYTPVDDSTIIDGGDLDG